MMLFEHVGKVQEKNTFDEAIKKRVAVGMFASVYGR